MKMKELHVHIPIIEIFHFVSGSDIKDLTMITL